MFGTDDVIFRPEGQPLIFEDVYRWERYAFDIGRYGARLRPSAFETITARMRAALELVKKSPRFAGMAEQIETNTEDMVRDLTQITGQMREEIPGALAERMKGERPLWWIQVTDLPAESFFEEDYERDAAAEGYATPYLTYGTARISQLDGLEVNLSGDEKNEEGEAEWPFAIDVPHDGLTREQMPDAEPLPLVEEFCGAHGASAHGRTINIDTHGNLAENHQFCTPLGRVGRLYVTLYIHHTTGGDGTVLGKLHPDQLFPTASLLKNSGFHLDQEGPAFRIYQRDGDVIHLYSQLAGKEAEGVETMPPFMVVARAGGEHDPLHRSELYEAIRETMNSKR